MKKNKFLLILAAMGSVALGACSAKESINSSIVESAKPDSISIDGLKEEYGLGSSIDLSDLSLIVKYSNDSTQKISLFDENVSYDNFDTSEEGIHTIRISYYDISVSVSYNVRRFKLTLDFNGGKYQNEASLDVSVEKNKADISKIEPISDKEGYKFAGWFYDKELTQRVEFQVKDEINIFSDTTIYAGYDVDYTKVFEYEIKDDEVTLTSFIQNKYEATDTIFIPRTIDLYPVTSIGDNFAYDEDPWSGSNDFSSYYDITNLIFEEGSCLRYIGKNAFNNVSLTNVNFPDTIEKIDEHAFYYTKMTKLVLPKNIKSIEAYAFSFNCDLEEVDFNDSELISIGRSAFADCMKLNQVTLSNKIEIIGSEAFSYCTNFKEFNIPASVETIGVNVFSGFPNLKSINVDLNNKKFKSIDGNLYSKDGTIFYRYCYGNTNKEFLMPNTVKIIFEGAFNIVNENAYLENLVLNEGIEEIGDLAFENTSIDFTLPSTLLKFGQKAFYGWNGHEFKINSANKNFKVVNNSLVSFDGKVLYAIAEGYPKNVYELDNNVEEITSYVCKSLPVSAFIVGKDSHLKIIYRKSLELSNFKNLNYFYILKEEPFEIENETFYADNFKYNLDYKFIVNSNIDGYKNAWQNITNYDDILISDELITPSDYMELQLEKINDNLNVTSFNAFCSYNQFISANDYYANFYNLINALKVSISILRLNVEIPSQELDYLKSFILDVVTKSIDYFSTKGASELTISECNYQKFYNYYQMIPMEVLSDLTSDYQNKAQELATLYQNVMANVSQIMADITSFEYSDTKFDVDKYNDIMQRVSLYKFNQIQRTNNQDLAFYKLEVQNLLYLFDTIDYNIDHYSDLYKIYNGSYLIADNYSLGIKFYLDNFLTDEEENKTLYGYLRLQDNLEKLANLENEVILEINNKFNSFEDKEIYEDGMYDELFACYEKLENKNLLDYDIVLKHNSYLLRFYYNEFIKLSTKEETGSYYSLSEFPDDILVKLNMVGANMSVVYDYDANYLLNLIEYDTVCEVIDNYNNKYYEISGKETIDDSYSYDEVISYFDKYKNFIYSTGDDRYYNAIIIANDINNLNGIVLDSNNYEEIFNLIEGKIKSFIDNYSYDQKVMNIFDSILEEGSYDWYLNLVSML